MSDQNKKNLEYDNNSTSIPENELERVMALADLDLDYSELHDNLKDLSKLAAHVAGTKISFVNLIDTYTKWSVSNYGMEGSHMPRENSVCQFTILEDDKLEISSLSHDERFKDKKYVVSGPQLEYYFGIPLTTENGYNIGAMCMFDTETKELTPEKVELLKIIAKEIVQRLESIHKITELKQNLDSISDLPRKVLHDIRGPVGGIVGLAEIIKDEAKEKHLDDIMELIEMINKGGKSVLELADEILSAHSEDEDGVPEPDKHEFNLVLLREKLQELFKPQATSKGVNLEIGTSGQNPELPFPKHKLLQIIGNLISNAIKFTPEEGRVSVDLNLKENDENEDGSHFLDISVEDTGVGMKPEQVEKLQSKDQGSEKSSSEGTGGERGYGFGLRLVKHLVKTLDGDMKISSSRGEGSQIGIQIPMKL